MWGICMFLHDSNTKGSFEAHISKLHPFLFQAEYIDPTDVARRDVITSFLVESVLQHSGDNKRRSTLDFLVKFVGCEDEHNLWLPYSEMRNNEKCHEYLRANGMSNLIPKDPVPKQSDSQVPGMRSSAKATKRLSAKQKAKHALSVAKANKLNKRNLIRTAVPEERRQSQRTLARNGVSK